jgi:hypothetical protein
VQAFLTMRLAMFSSGKLFRRWSGRLDESPNHSLAANAGIVIGQDGVLVEYTLINRDTEKHMEYL